VRLLDRDLPEMPASFRAQLDAALARPVLLAPSAAEAVASAGAFRPQGASADAKGAKGPGFERDGDVAVLRIEGPLAQRAWSCWMFEGEGYDRITDRAQAALADNGVRALLLRIDSPGGEVAGCFDAARAIRAAADRAGKPVVAYADEMACSAAYALATAADEIVAPDTGVVGSVGVITVVHDRTAANAREGRNVRVVRSGQLKAVPHPDDALTPEAVARVQADIDGLAAIFADLVAARRGMTREGVLALEADAFLGAEAVARGLADRVGNYGAALARARELAAARRTTSPASHAAAATHGDRPTMKTLLAAMGLSPEASEAEALAAYNAKSSALAQFEALTGKAGPEALGVAHAFKASHARVEAVEAQLAAHRAEQERADRKALLDGAVADGKLTPHERGQYEADPALAALPLAAVRAIVATTPKRVATEARAATAEKPSGASAHGLSDEELRMAAAAGVTPEEFAARKAARAARKAS
jgi:signal peptide peptidase SppA